LIIIHIYKALQCVYVFTCLTSTDGKEEMNHYLKSINKLQTNFALAWICS